jgi:GYF domain 2
MPPPFRCAAATGGARMAERLWYTAIGGRQEGPFSDARLRDLITAGSVRADTLVWCDGMSNWAKAEEIPGLMSSVRSPPPPLGSPPSVAGAGPADAGTTSPLATRIRVWPFFGRGLLIIIADIFIVPTPWVMTSFYRWFVDNLDLPGGQRVAFAGKPGDIWYIFMANALCGYVGLAGHGVNLLLLPLTTLFLLLIIRWFSRNLVWEGQTAPLVFTGGYWPMLGWYVLFILSFITIIGWAWVSTAWTRWMCRHLEGSVRKLVFNATGWGLLWRTVLFALSCVLLIPIPWTLHWYTRWLVSQCALTTEAAAGALAA